MAASVTEKPANCKRRDSWAKRMKMAGRYQIAQATARRREERDGEAALPVVVR